MSEKQKIIGIDYGSKLAGTTVICYNNNNKIQTLQSEKKKDADAMILKFCDSYNPKLIFIDAPLSLPSAYFNDTASDYFYREADKVTQAMSPMFIGGLTARAIKLKNALQAQNREVIETYPRQLVKHLSLEHFYKKDIKDFLQALETKIAMPNLPEVDNWHSVDAILAYSSAQRFTEGKSELFGNPEEGVIYI